MCNYTIIFILLILNFRSIPRRERELLIKIGKKFCLMYLFLIFVLSLVVYPQSIESRLLQCWQSTIAFIFLITDFLLYLQFNRTVMTLENFEGNKI